MNDVDVPELEVVQRAEGVRQLELGIQAIAPRLQRFGAPPLEVDGATLRRGQVGERAFAPEAKIAEHVALRVAIDVGRRRRGAAAERLVAAKQRVAAALVQAFPNLEAIDVAADAVRAPLAQADEAIEHLFHTVLRHLELEI